MIMIINEEGVTFINAKYSQRLFYVITYHSSYESFSPNLFNS